MSRQEILNVQTLELQVPIHCDGCLEKVKKVVQKIDGVYQSNVDAVLGKVTVTGLMDLETVITKIRKAGKPVRVWGSETGTPVEVQFEMLQLRGAAGGGKRQQQAKDVGAKGQQQEPKEAGDKGKQQHQAKDANDKGHVQAKVAGGKGQLQQWPKGGAAGGGAMKGAKMVAPQPTPTPQQMMEMKGMKFPPPELMGMGAGKMSMPFPVVQAMQAKGAKDPRTVKFDIPGGDEFGDDSSGFGDEFDELDDVDFDDDDLDDVSDDPTLMTRSMGMPPGAAGGGNGGAKNGGGTPGGGNLPGQAKKGSGPAGASLSGPVMKPPHMMGAGGGAGFPVTAQMGTNGEPLGGMPTSHPQMGGVGMQQGRGAAHGKPFGGMPMGMGLPNMGGAGIMHGKPTGSMPMGHPNMGGANMWPNGSGAHGMPAPGLFPGGGAVMPIGPEMLPMSKLPPQQQQHMATVMQQQQQHMAAIMQQQQQQMLLNDHGHGHGHHHAHHGHHHGHHTHGYPPPPQPSVGSYGYGYGHPPMPYYYSLPPQRHPHDNFFSDENPNGCSVM